MPTGVIVEPSTSETFAPGELADAYKKFMEHGSQYLDAESGIEVSVYRFGMRVLVVYEEIGAGLVVLTHPTCRREFAEVGLPFNGVLRS